MFGANSSFRPAREHVVRFHRHHRPQLPLHPQRHHVAVRRVVVAERNLVRHRPAQAPRPVPRLVARRRQHLVVGRRRPVERVHRKVGPSVVDHRQRHVLDLQLRLVRRIRFQLREEQPIPAPDHRPVRHLIRKAGARREVVQVVRPLARHPRLEHDLLAVPPEVRVIAHAQVHRQTIADRPVVLEPPGKEVPLDGPGKVADGHGVVAHEGGQRLQVPRGGVVPHRNQLSGCSRAGRR